MTAPALPAFIAARLDDNEHAAQVCLRALIADRTPYAVDLHRRPAALSVVTSRHYNGREYGPTGTVDATPGRILAQVRADRALLAYLTGPQSCDGLDRTCPECAALRAMAHPYTWHEDYDEAWTFEG